MNFKKLLPLVLVTFVVIWVSDFIFHGMIMGTSYQSTAHLWRPESEFMQLMPFRVFGQMVVALFFSLIFIHGYKGTGVGEGVRYGMLLAGFQAGGQIIMYSVAPYPSTMVGAWIIGCFAQCILAGVIATKVYKI